MGLGKGYARGVLTKSANFHNERDRRHWGETTPDSERYQQYVEDQKTLLKLLPAEASTINWYQDWRALHTQITAILEAHANLVDAINDTDNLIDCDSPVVSAAAAAVEDEARAAYLAEQEYLDGTDARDTINGLLAGLR